VQLVGLPQELPQTEKIGHSPEQRSLPVGVAFAKVPLAITRVGLVLDAADGLQQLQGGARRALAQMESVTDLVERERGPWRDQQQADDPPRRRRQAEPVVQDADAFDQVLLVRGQVEVGQRSLQSGTS
jgi:hypothetical protein